MALSTVGVINAMFAVLGLCGHIVALRRFDSLQATWRSPFCGWYLSTCIMRVAAMLPQKEQLQATSLQEAFLTLNISAFPRFDNALCG